MAGFDELSSRYGNKLYIVTYGDFIKLGVTSTPLKRIKTIVNAFGNDIDLEESCYYQMPETLANTIETKIKREFDKYEGAKRYKTECFNIEDRDDILDRIEELSEPFSDEVEKVHFIKHVTLIIDEETEKPVIRNTRSLYSIYRLIMNNPETFDDLFLDRLERERLEKSEDKRM